MSQDFSHSDSVQKPTSSSSRGRLFSLSFLGLLVTQFTVAMNDNIFRWLLVPIGKARLGVYYGDYEAGANQAIAIGALMFLIPFVLFSGYGGYCADRFCKRKVMIWCKVAEVFIMALGVLFIWIGNPWLLFVVLFLMGTQSAFYSPAKYASIPEIVGDRNIPTANGLIGMSTIVAVLAGTVLGGCLYVWTTLPDADGLRHMSTAPGQHQLWLSAAVLIGVAVLGLLWSLLIQKMPARGKDVKFPRVPMQQSFSDLSYLWKHKALWLVAIGSAYYWGLASLAQTNIDRFVLPEIIASQDFVAFFLGILAVGIAVGSMLVGFIMRGQTTLKPIVFSAFGMATCAVALYFTPEGTGKISSSAGSYALTVLLFLGIFAGMFDIPLLAYLQKNSDESQRGRIIGGSNFLSFSGMTLGALFFGALISSVGTRGIWLLAGILTFGVAFICLFFVYLPQVTALAFHVFYRVFYRVEIEGAENLPKEGPYVLASNHVSYLDGMLMYFMLPFGRKRKPRIIFWSAFGKPPILHQLSIAYRGIPIEPGKQSVRAIREASRALEDGEIVGIFPEGGITRHGTLMPFKPGIEHMLRGRENVLVVPMYIGGLWGSIFSFKGGKFIWKWPQRCSLRRLLRLKFRRRITISIGKPIQDFRNQDVRALPDAIQELQRKYFTEHEEKTGWNSDNFNPDMIPVRQMLYKLKSRKNAKKLIIADMTLELTRRKTLIGSLVFRRKLHQILERDEQNVGVLIPPCVPCVLTSAALGLDRRTAVNLNYTVSNEIMNHCIRKVGMRHVVTSKKVMADKNFAKFTPDCEMIYLEDIKASVTLWDKVCAVVQAVLLPTWILEHLLGLHRISPESAMTIVFTSGSTGVPKGVVLSHKNVGGNIQSFCEILQLGEETDSALGILPFFHSFGYTCLLWTVLTRGIRGYYHTSPLDCGVVAKLCRKYAPTLVVGTPTFLRMYARRLDREDLSSVQIVVSGAERCPAALMEEYEKRFGIRPVQGYGVTEAAPVISVNLPKTRLVTDWAPKQKDASIGLPLAGVSVQVRNLDTGEPCKANEVGMLWVSGINVMGGYYEEPEKTAEVLQDGWYCTGDLVYLDEENFLFIAGRLSRFAKIGGEMVPHEGLEEALNKILGNNAENEPKLCVTSVPDEKKGEKIIVLYTELSLTPEELNARLLEQNYPPLWVPNVDAYFQIPEIPLLGTGKLDLHAIHDMALEKVA
ncbi:MAG: MFS transporter [Planctomycetia bacterium]|nr:MFS transporter [Planctomycetia bacterium]